MHFILHNVWSVNQNKFSDLQTDRLNWSSNVLKINGWKFSRSILQTSILLIYNSHSLTWRACFNFPNIYFGRILFSLSLLTGKILFQNWFKRCIFSRVLFHIDHFGAVHLIYWTLLRKIFFILSPFIFVFSIKIFEIIKCN